MAHPAYRFYNTVSDSHFYTVDAAERDSVIANLPTFKYEGPTFGTVDASMPGSVGVFRFYNDTNKTHFFTADPGERDTVINTLPNYHYEGVAYHAAAAPADGLQPLFRFYNVDAQTHFYTADPAERDSVAATLPNFRYEGVAYYEPKADAPYPIYSRADNQTLTGDDGNDAMYALHRNITMHANGGDDYLAGGDGNDTLDGGAGNDAITGGKGNDALTGGAGNDTFIFHRGDGTVDHITDFSGGDVLRFPDITAGEFHWAAPTGGPGIDGHAVQISYGGIGMIRETFGNIYLDGVSTLASDRVIFG